MKASFLVTNEFNNGLKLILGKKRTSRFFSSVNTALYPLTSSSEDETTIFEDSSSSYIDQLSRSSCISVDRDNRLCTGRKHVYGFCNAGISASKFQEWDSDDVETVKSILAKSGWNFWSPKGYWSDLDEANVIRALNDLFKKTTNAAVVLCFFRWLESSLGWKHTARSLCTMVCILVFGNMNYRALDLLIRLVSEHQAEYGLCDPLLGVLQETCSERKIGNIVYSMLVKCYIMEELIDRAVGAIREMEQLGVFPSAAVCNSLIRSLLGFNRAEMAWDILEKMQSRGLVGACTLGLFVNYYCSQGSLECGWKFLVDMVNHGNQPDVVVYTIIIDFLCKIPLPKEATTLVFKMMQMGFSPDSVLLSSIVNGYCKMPKPELEDALKIIKFFRVPPNAFIYNSFISKLSKDSNMEHASILFHEMSDLGVLPDCFCYTTIIGGYCKAGDMNKAFEYLARMFKSGIKPSVTTYTILIDSYCDRGEVEMAEGVLQKMKLKSLKSDVVLYNTLIKGYGKKGYLHKAFELLDMMQSDGISPDVVSYNTIIHGLIVRGFIYEAKDIMDELIRRGFSPDIVTLTDIIGGFSNRGKFEEAFLVWSYMSKHKMKPDVITCNALLNGYCRARRMDEANVLFQKMLDTGLMPDLILYNTMIHGFCSVGYIDSACRLIGMMVEHNIIPNDVTFRALIHGYEVKCVDRPVESARFKLQQLLLKYGMEFIIGHSE